MPYFHAFAIDGQRFSRVATRAYSHLILHKDADGTWGEVAYSGRADLANARANQAGQHLNGVMVFEVEAIEMTASQAASKRKAFLAVGEQAQEAPEEPAAIPAPAPVAEGTIKTREQWLHAFTDLARPHFEAAGAPIPSNVRCSIGFSSKGARSNRIGECWGDIASQDKHFEIFIVPSLQSDSSRIADILTHELIHAAVGIEAGHKAPFRRVAVALGLEGKMTATVAGEGWHKWADPILEAIGPMPGAALGEALVTSAPKKQTTRMLKVECPDCGFSFRTTRQHLDAHEELTCPTGCGGILEKPE